ncbi:Actin cross-linking [Phytophthora cactorum]|nr:Actin cross-linking [Phytophthora cactorum]
MASKVPLLLLSLGTSGVLLQVAAKLSDAVANTSAVPLAFFALLPALVSISVVTEGHGWGFFAQLWETLTALLAAGRQAQEHKITPAEALAAARAELFKAFSERWPQHGHASLSRPLGLSSQRPEVVSSSTSGSSLYEQVKGSLKDHIFSRSAADAPVYLMDPATGCFLRATQHRKLVFTSKPNASCLFHVERGKTHHWGFRAAATQRYMGQNIVQKMVATSKKLHAWEAFRVLQRPGDKGAGVCSPQVYLILCSARFGKGMWLANKPGSTSFAHPSVPTGRSNSASIEGDEDLLSDHDRNGHGSSRKRGVFLSKQFDHSFGLMYSSDLSALLAAAADAASQSGASSARALARAQTAPHLTGGLLQAKGTTFQAPMLTRWDLSDVRLPWLEAVTATGRTPSFLEMREEDMTELMTATISGSSVNEFLEMIAPRTTRLKCKKERSKLATSAPVGSSSNTNTTGDKGGDDVLHEWHSHPRFGLNLTLNSMKAVTIEQYHSCTIDDDSLDDEQEGDHNTPHKASLRSKIYTLSIPYSNCFSIEVLVEVEDALVSDDAAKERSSDGKQPKTPGNKTALHIRWRAGVVFSRDTILKAQIERGALEGVRSSCATLLKLLRDADTRQHFTSLPVRRGSIVGVDTPSNATTDTATALAASGDVSSGRGTRGVKPDLAFLPRTFALEVMKGLIAAISDANPLSGSLSTLPIQLPWRSFSRGPSSTRGIVPSQAMAAATAAPFFESIPEEFAQVLEENMGSKVTASLFFEALLSDACSFFRPAHADSGNMEVDISAWRAIVASGQSRERTNGFIRKQSLKLRTSNTTPLSRLEAKIHLYLLDIHTDSGRGDKRGTDSSRGDKRGGGSHPSRDRKRPPSGLSKDPKTRDLKPRTSKRRRLEFGMKLFVPALPEGSQFSIEVLAIVEPADDDSSTISFASSSPRLRVIVNPRRIWKQVAHTMMEICETNSDYVVLPTQLQPHTSQGLDEQELYLLQQSRANPNLPTHDELASRVIEAIAAVY